MRILVVSQYFWPENFRVNDLVAELVRRGHQLTVLTGYPNYPGGQIFPEFSAQPAAYARFHGVEVVRVPLLTRGRGGKRLLANYLSFAITASVLGRWRLRRRQFDVIFAWETSPITVGIPAAAMRAAKRAPLVFWVLDLWPETLQAIGVVRSRWALAQVGRLVRWIYARCDLILAQSRSFIPQIAMYCEQPDRIRYFPSWAETLYQATDVVPAEELERRAGCFTVLFAGNIGEAQDFESILAAAHLLRDDARIRWVVLGDGRMAQWLRQEIARRGLASCFTMLGTFPVERMPSFFAHADALLVSLKKEPLFSLTIPGKVQAYLAAGIPVLAMLDGEGAAIIRQAGAGLTCPAGEPAALAAAVRSLAAMPVEQRRAMGVRGRQFAASEFDRDTLITRLEAWFEELRHRAPTPAGRGGK
jgi:colanic acid biosynthesis glycosyl transferase WcaI